MGKKKKNSINIDEIVNSPTSKDLEYLVLYKKIKNKLKKKD